MLLNDETRWVIISKHTNRYDPLNEIISYRAFRLNDDGVANVSISTSSRENNFNLQVKDCLFEIKKNHLILCRFI